MIPFGPWHPDAAGINSPAMIKAKGCVPARMDTSNGPVATFAPELSPSQVSNPLGDQLYDVSGGSTLYDDSGQPLFQSDGDIGSCIGLTSVILNDGSVVQFAGTRTDLYELAAGTGEWSNVTRTSGGDYTVSGGERWNFAFFNPTIICTDYTDVPQKFDTSSATNFSALGGSPPKARFVGIVRDQVVLACIAGQENALQFSGYNNSEIWTTGGLNGADIQIFPDGGPITGFVGGAVGHVFQATKITRMSLSQQTAPDGTPLIYQFDEVQGAKGCVASNSIVKVGDLIYYFAADGFYVLSISTGECRQIGLNKWRQWFLDDYRPGTERLILGAFDPISPVIRWAYVSNSTASATLPGRMLIYNWALDEATYADLDVEAMSQWLSSGVTLDTMPNAYNLDTLPFSLDSPFWKGGVPLIAFVDDTHRLNYLEGEAVRAEFITADGLRDSRSLIRGTTPIIDTTAITAAIAMRERDGDASNNEVSFPAQEVMEDTGSISAHVSGFVARAQYIIPAGARWTMFKGVKTSVTDVGGR